MSWRPEGWKSKDGFEVGGSWLGNDSNRHYYFEAGADAMLEALEKHGKYYTILYSHITDMRGNTWWKIGIPSGEKFHPVVIPDEQEDK